MVKSVDNGKKCGCDLKQIGPGRIANPIMKYFAYSHLPEKFKGVSRDIGVVAGIIDKKVPNSVEKSAGMRKLLEAKDCL